MAEIELFPKGESIGVFRSFQQGGLEFHADVSLPYKGHFQSMPMHGQFLLVQLETPNEAVLGRIKSIVAEGKLPTSVGEQYTLRAVEEDRQVPDDIREQHLRYRVNIRVLGVLRRHAKGMRITFAPSQRRLPHVGNPVAFLNKALLREVIGHTHNGVADQTSAHIGHLALGEYVYAAGSKHFASEPWVQLLDPEVQVRFPVEALLSRRSFIFARAGFGKSNLNKLLFAALYQETPTVQKRGEQRVPVGTIIFDPDGEYFWPDDKARPGLCDVPALEDKVVVFTARKSSSPFYGSFVADGVRLDIRRLKPSDVIAIALSPERQEQQNVRKLSGLNMQQWEKLVDVIDAHGQATPLVEVASILGLETRQEMEVLAARANMTVIVKTLHSKSSQLIDKLMYALQAGKLCVVDVSQMRVNAAMMLSGLILRYIFERNQEQFTEAEPKTLPTIAVVEEAQSVLNADNVSAEPYIAWVKEGRKYDLGALLITQQPGSIPAEILSQGDNWFVFHLLSEGDLWALQKANGHFSVDILSSLLNEPIPGHGVFWSSVGGKPYPIPLRALSFERLYQARDPHYRNPPGNTFAQQMAQHFPASPTPIAEGNTELIVEVDHKENIEQDAIRALSESTRFQNAMASAEGIAWGGVMGILMKHLPETIDDKSQFAYNMVKKAMDVLYGPAGYESYAHPTRNTRYLRRK